MTTPGLCLFDLDETLIPIDSDHAWGEFMIRIGWVDAATLRPARIPPIILEALKQ